MKSPTLAGRELADYYHVCAFFDSRDDEYRVLNPFFQEGLNGGEKILHIVDPALIEDHLAKMKAGGIDTEA